jgi:hypothetical protein
VPAFDPGVPGYDPQTGEVQKYSGPGSAAMGAADVATFGLGDEAAAAMGTGIDMLPGGKGASYDQNLAEIRGNQQTAQTENPKSYIAGQVAGGVAQGLAAGPGILANAPSTLARVGGGMLTGAGMGGAYGLGSGEGIEGRLYEGGKDALIGGAVGGLIPAAAKGVSSGYSGYCRYAGGPGGRQIGRVQPVCAPYGRQRPRRRRHAWPCGAGQYGQGWL